ncbi:DUF4258 domain-containing protein [Bacillus cereus]|nr:DUF4258 domain-containing protein [Bacillus cereus]
MLRFLWSFLYLKEELIMKKELKNEIVNILKRKVNGCIKLGIHVPNRCNQRGYTKSDLVYCLMKGEIIKISSEAFKGKNVLTIKILGVDTDNNPLLVVLGKEGIYQFKCITITPPIKEKLMA